jgi:hypothetical protein
LKHGSTGGWSLESRGGSDNGLASVGRRRSRRNHRPQRGLQPWNGARDSFCWRVAKHEAKCWNAWRGVVLVNPAMRDDASPSLATSFPSLRNNTLPRQACPLMCAHTRSGEAPCARIAWCSGRQFAKWLTIRRRRYSRSALAANAATDLSKKAAAHRYVSSWSGENVSSQGAFISSC